MEPEIKVDGMTELDALRWIQGRISRVEFGGSGCSITIYLQRSHTKDVHVVAKTFLDAVIEARKALQERGFPDGPA